MSNLLKEINNLFISNVKAAWPKFRIGDVLKVELKIKEGEKERLQAFEGLLIADKGTGVARMLTLRKVSYTEGVERIFPLYSPCIEKIEVICRNKVRKAKLYYLRKLKGKLKLIERTEK
ncbi:MAG: 50S ribosomal protein L19 [Deltaproteobacteria bacterium]|nr:MAG: 50S ribosomal protein L19 [Deltaproteobacteria bacterium]